MPDSPRPARLTPPAQRGTALRRAQLASTRAHGLHSSPTPAVLYSSRLGGKQETLQFHTFDAAYIGRLRAGDRETEQHFVAYFTHLLRLKLRSRLQSQHAIEDVTQETFVRVLAVLGKEPGLRQPESLGAFVNTVCTHVLQEHYRSAGGTISLDSEGQPELPSRAASALDLAVTHQVKDKVRAILLDIAPRDRSLLKAVFLDERDRDEVCSDFGVDRDYLRVLLHRAKQEFKTEYLRQVPNRASIPANSRNT